MAGTIEEELHAAKAGNFDALAAVLGHVEARCRSMAKSLRKRYPAAAAFEETADLFQLSLTKLLEQYGSNPGRLPDTGDGLHAHTYQKLRDIWVDLARKFVRPDGVPKVEAVAEIGDRVIEETSVSGRLSRKENAEAIRCAMGELPAREQAVVVLHYQEGLPLVEIAAVLGLNERTIRRSHQNALDLLLVGLGRIGPEL